ncbi:MAG TPA: hypothetical protein VE261_04815 [Gaiellaceae bacterium]|nr:hypothetical protein [Gaiellaceae bacterium]
MALSDDLERIAAAAGPGLTGVLPAELLDGTRVYLCAFESGEWLALDAAGQPVTSRRVVREAASLAALCEVAEEASGAEPEHPRLATNAYLDSFGAGIASAVEQAASAVAALADEVERRHRTPLA